MVSSFLFVLQVTSHRPYLCQRPLEVSAENQSTEMIRALHSEQDTDFACALEPSQPGRAVDSSCYISLRIPECGVFRKGSKLNVQIMGIEASRIAEAIPAGQAPPAAGPF